jgi:hypothetical protein
VLDEDAGGGRVRVQLAAPVDHTALGRGHAAADVYHASFEADGADDMGRRGRKVDL